MITDIQSHRKSTIGLKFDNGNHISIIFGPGTYSDNYDVGYAERYSPGVISSKTVEIMVDGDDKFTNWFEKKYEGVNPCGYIPVGDINLIIKKADSKVYGKTHNG